MEDDNLTDGLKLEDFDYLVGTDIASAMFSLPAGWTLQVLAMDGVYKMHANNVQARRVNVKVVGGLISAVISIT